MFTIFSVTPEKVESLKEKLTANGTSVKVVTNNHYQIVGNGITAVVTFDEPNQELNVTILKKPFIVTEGFIEGKIREALG